MSFQAGGGYPAAAHAGVPTSGVFPPPNSMPPGGGVYPGAAPPVFGSPLMNMRPPASPFSPVRLPMGQPGILPMPGVPPGIVKQPCIMWKYVNIFLSTNSDASDAGLH